MRRELPLAAGQDAFLAPPEGIRVEALARWLTPPGSPASTAARPAGRWSIASVGGERGPGLRSLHRISRRCWRRNPGPSVIAVDMPIGLPERVGPGGRGPEREVRRLLGERQSSVFAVPSRAAVMEDDYRRSCDVALATSEPPKKVSKQCFHLFPKIREIDRLMTPGARSARLRGAPRARLLAAQRRAADGAAEEGEEPAVRRRASTSVRRCSSRHGYDRAFLDQPLPRGVGRDDLLDAAALALTATRIANGEGRSFPARPERDGKGLRMAIWA